MASKKQTDMADDKQQQEDELGILKSILGETITVLSDENDQFDIKIIFQLPSPFSLRLSDGANQLSTVIQHLPPLALTVHFHEQYPSATHPPHFVLSSWYLPRVCLERMCEGLDSIWEQDVSQPVVYQWVEYLKERFLTVDTLQLSNEEPNADGDEPRAMSSYEPNQATRIYEQLIDYNREQENEQFLREYHECPICLSSNVSGRHMLRLYKCHHAFCRECLHEYAQMHVNIGTVEWLLCPDSNCQLAMLPAEIKTVLNDDQLYEKYERLLLQKTLDQMLDVVWCPRCQQAVVTDNNDKLVICAQCRYSFCKKCRKTYHSESSCDFEEKEALLRDKYRKMRAKLRDLNLSKEGHESILREFLATAKIDNITRLCPNYNCQVPIEKSEGCDHMYCVRCHTRFNWSDAKDQTSETKAFFEQFEKELDELPEMMANGSLDDDSNFDSVGGKALPLLVQLMSSRMKKCPNATCGKLHIKRGNSNYVICAHCKRSFCLQCGKPIKDIRTHFLRACVRYSNV